MTLGKDPMFACCIMYPTDRELEVGITDIHLGAFAEDGFQGFPLRAARIVRRHRPAAVIADDLVACGFNTVFLVGFCGSNFTPRDLRSPRFVELTRELHARRMTVGVCIPFADTVDNALTRSDPDMYQRRHDGKRTFIRFDAALEEPPYPLYNIDYGCERFIAFAMQLVVAARDAGMDFIDYAEPDYWPTEENGYGGHLAEAWRARYGRPLPYPSTPEHRFFMEDYHIDALRRISAFAHEQGLGDHLTASPMGHVTRLIGQNYGKYSTTAITELSSTYHPEYGRGWAVLLRERYGITGSGHRVSSLGCLETRAMRDDRERHATYLVPGQSLPPETCAEAVDQQMYLHNMDLVFWDYPSLRENYYETTEPWFGGDEAWVRLSALLRAKAERYRALPSRYHHATPRPEALVLYSKRGVHAEPAEDAATPCVYATALKLQAEQVLPGFLFPEHLEPLSDDRGDARVLLVDQHQPTSPDTWAGVRAWLRKGSRAVVYGGAPGWRWDLGGRHRVFPAEVERLFGVQRGRAPRSAKATKESPWGLPPPVRSEIQGVVPSAAAKVVAWSAGRPFVTLKRLPGGSLAVYIAAALCELPQVYLARMTAWLLDTVGGRRLTVESPVDLETRLYEGEGSWFVALKNHSAEQRTARFAVATRNAPTRVEELMEAGPTLSFEHRDGWTIFRDAPPPSAVRIYEITGRGDAV